MIRTYGTLSVAVLVAMAAWSCKSSADASPSAERQESSDEPRQVHAPRAQESIPSLERPGSAEELGAYVRGALASGSKEALLGLFPSESEFDQLCSGYPEGDYYDKFRKRAAESFERCLDGRDWGGASMVRHEGGTSKGRTEKGCPGLTKASDFHLHLRVGGEQVEVEIDNPFLADDEFVPVPEPLFRDGQAPASDRRSGLEGDSGGSRTSAAGLSGAPRPSSVRAGVS